MLIEEMLKIQLRKKGSQFSEKYNNEKESKNSYSEFLSKNMNPQKRLEIEALSLIINGSDYPDQEILNLPLDYFKFEDTKELFKLLKSLIYEQIDLKKNLNFPILISSDTLENENIRKLYNYIYFSNKNYTHEKDSCKEVILNLKKLFLSEKIEKIKNKISEIEQIIRENKLSGNENKDTVNLENKIDEYYKELISLENEKLLSGKDK
jgi:hypothetical protein